MTLSLAAEGVQARQEKECVMLEVEPCRATTSWRKSSASGQESCVQVSRSHTQVWVRDSKDAVGPVLSFTRHSWTAFLVGVQCGEFDCARERPVSALP
jgi:hypothetical protein